MSSQLHWRFVFSAIMGAAIGAIGTYLSSMSENLPTGPIIVLTGFVFFVLAATFGPYKSIFSVFLKKLALQRIRLEENILRGAYYFYEKGHGPVSVLNLMSRSSENRDVPAARKVLRHFLKTHVFIEKSPGQYELSPKGISLAEKIVRKHRVWESFIVSKLGVSPERAHDNAEIFEHYVDEDILRRIEGEEPATHDPHGKSIPPASQGEKNEQRSHPFFKWT